MYGYVSRTKNKRGLYKIYTGDLLKSYRSDRYKMKKRFEVKLIFEFCTDGVVDEKICGVVGIRGTGKTIALLHTIDKLNDYDNTVYIEIKENVTIERLISIIESYRGFKYVFINGISRVTGFMEKAHFISSRYASSGIKIVISGTDSYAIQNTLYDALCHRIHLVRMGYISFEEQNMLEDMYIDDYIKYGGLLDKSLRQMNNSKTLLEKLVIEDIVNSIIRNREYYKKRGLIPLKYLNPNTDILRVSVRTTIFYVYYMIITRNLQGIQHLRLQNYKKFDKSNFEFERDFLDYMEIHESIDGELLRFITETLLDLGLIKKVCRYKKMGEYRYYITTPAIAYRLYCDLVQFKEVKGVETKIVDNMFEATVMCELLNMTDKVWYYAESEDVCENRGLNTICALLNNDKFVIIESVSDENFDFDKWKQNFKPFTAFPEKSIGAIIVVFRENFEGFANAEKVMIKSDDTTSESGTNEVHFVHFNKLKNKLREIYENNMADEPDILSVEWDI